MLIPEGYRIVVKPEKAEAQTSGGIYVPETTQDTEQRAKTQGTFVSAGPNVDLNFGDKKLEPGMRLLFVQYAGVNYKEDGETLWVLNDQDILGIIE